MSLEQIIEYCWWYLDHLHLLLIAAAIFDIICWIAIAIYVRKKRMGGQPPRHVAGSALATPPPPAPPVSRVQ